jgi:protein-S-isoprenylcysteine O-methyltransferase Ste14
MVRLNVMALWLLPREIAVEELTLVMLIWVPAILVSFALLTSIDKISLTAAIVSVFLYGVGSILNTGSELERKVWKQHHPGQCYTGGMFALSRNINYFGDTLLFAAWAMMTGCWWNLWVPIVMGLSFYYYHIPEKESYLAQKYKEQWPQYVARTKSFIPYVC